MSNISTKKLLHPHTAACFADHWRIFFLFSSNVVDYAPVAKCFAEASMDRSTLAKTKKFDISSMIAKEKLAFTKMKTISELKESHGVDLGVGYKNNNACAIFVSFVAKEQKIVHQFPIKNQFFLALKPMPVLMLEIWSSELFLITYFDAFAKDGVIHI